MSPLPSSDRVPISLSLANGHWEHSNVQASCWWGETDTHTGRLSEGTWTLWASGSSGQAYCSATVATKVPHPSLQLPQLHWLGNVITRKHWTRMSDKSRTDRALRKELPAEEVWQLSLTPGVGLLPLGGTSTLRSSPEHPVSPRAWESWCTHLCPCHLFSPHRQSPAVIHPNPWPGRNLHNGLPVGRMPPWAHAARLWSTDHLGTFYIFSENVETTFCPSVFHLCLGSWKSSFLPFTRHCGSSGWCKEGFDGEQETWVVPSRTSVTAWANHISLNLYVSARFLCH